MKNKQESPHNGNVQYLHLALRWCTWCPVWQDEQSVFRDKLAGESDVQYGTTCAGDYMSQDPLLQQLCPVIGSLLLPMRKQGREQNGRSSPCYYGWLTAQCEERGDSPAAADRLTLSLPASLSVSKSRWRPVGGGGPRVAERYLLHIYKLPVKYSFKAKNYQM